MYFISPYSITKYIVLQQQHTLAYIGSDCITLLIDECYVMFKRVLALLSLYELINHDIHHIRIENVIERFGIL